MARIQIVHNPASGSFDAQRFDRLVEAIAALGHETVTSVSSPTQPFRLEPNVAHVCAAGGDGTIRHVAAALIRETNPPTMSVYPMGTINLIAREIGWPADAKSFAGRINIDSDKPHLWPVRINDDCFIACASIGPDAQAVAGVSIALKDRIGRLAYAVALIKGLWNWQRPALRVVADGAEFACEAIYIANGRYFGGPWSFAPKAQLGQALLHIVALPKADRLTYVRFLLSMAMGRVESWSGARQMTVKTISVACDQAQPVQIDGDIGCATPIHIALTDRPLCG